MILRVFVGYGEVLKRWASIKCKRKDISAIFIHTVCGSEIGVNGAPILSIVNFLLFLEEKLYYADCLGKSWRSSGIIPSCQVLALISSSTSHRP